jgi:integrase
LLSDIIEKAFQAHLSKADRLKAPVHLPRRSELSCSFLRRRWNHSAALGASTIRAARSEVDGLPEGFTFHDLRHYLAPLLIASGADIKTVQARMRHASASTTLDVYGHLMPAADQSTRIAIAKVITERLGTAADALRTEEG